MKIYGQLEKAVLEKLASDPISPVEGQIWYNTTEKLTKTYDGTGVTELGASPEKEEAITYVGDVGGGVADYSSVQAALDNASDGDLIRLLSTTFTENITVTKNVKIVGSSNLSKIVGTVQFSTGSNGCHVSNVNVDGDVTVDLGVGNIIITDSWITSTSTVTDNSGLDTNIYLLVSY